MLSGFAATGATHTALRAAAATGVETGARAARRDDDAIGNFVTALANVRSAAATTARTNVREDEQHR